MRKTITIRLNEGEWAALEGAARVQGVSPGVLAKRRVVGALSGTVRGVGERVPSEAVGVARAARLPAARETAGPRASRSRVASIGPELGQVPVPSAEARGHHLRCACPVCVAGRA